MIKTEYIDSSNYEVLSFSLRLLTSIYKLIRILMEYI